VNTQIPTCDCDNTHDGIECEVDITGALHSDGPSGASHSVVVALSVSASVLAVGLVVAAVLAERRRRALFKYTRPLNQSRGVSSDDPNYNPDAGVPMPAIHNRNPSTSINSREASSSLSTGGSSSASSSSSSAASSSEGGVVRIKM